MFYATQSLCGSWELELWLRLQLLDLARVSTPYRGTGFSPFPDAPPQWDRRWGHTARSETARYSVERDHAFLHWPYGTTVL
jgi:hypothetical protein